MGGFVQSVGNGISSMMQGVFDTVGSTLRGLVNAGNQALPYGLFWVVIFFVLVITAWTFAKR
jgi:hypothetical protein